MKPAYLWISCGLGKGIRHCPVLQTKNTVTSLKLLRIQSNNKPGK